MSTVFLVSYIALWLLILTIGVLVLLMYRHFGVMSLGTLEGVQRDGLPVGAVAPSLGGITADGQEAGWEPRRGGTDLLLFVSPDCKPCETLLPVVNRLMTMSAAAGIGITGIVPGPRETVARLDERYRPAFRCLAEDGSGAFGRFRVRVTPFAFVIGADGRVLAKGLCSDPDRLQALLVAAGSDDIAAAVGAATASTMATAPLPILRRGEAVGVSGSNGTTGLGEGER